MWKITELAVQLSHARAEKSVGRLEILVLTKDSNLLSIQVQVLKSLLEYTFPSKCL